ncbi:hypothetical protein [Blastomonas aquatica]|uniref:GNAT family N-acetyltransferase n=1 Tax=Blastomonas aquatica TaxID=1510276 RepID=A0ABQ1JF65_9SPHN|nr:hypothetical protein [Blastomonas aquatica]GGB64841.1 hypothetical protein GCM10010833_20040 [Blastomonas aquatica]
MNDQPDSAEFDQPVTRRAGEPEASQFVSEVTARVMPSLIANVTAELTLVRHAGHDLPVVINHGDCGGSYVAAPHSAYVLYPKAELGLVDLGWLRVPASILIGLADRLFRTLRINHAVQIDNWLLSTNLHGEWTGAGIADLRADLARRYPNHFLVVRSVDPWSCPELLKNLRADGWLLLPSRQIWVTDDVERDWASRNSVKNDRRKLLQSGLIVEDVERLSDADAARIAQLYAMLYVHKYSALNPQYTPRWMQMAVATGLFHIRVARERDGQILAAAGIVARGGIATNPMLGYDTSRPQADGLYRIASWLVGDFARSHRLRVNGSAGAGHFKQQRGARSEIEYTAFHAGHLPFWRRAPLAWVALALEHLVIPVMKRRML